MGNTNPEVYWATEMEYADAYERAGCDVFLYREDQPADWDRLIKALRSPGQFDVVHWTRTKAFADKVGEAKQWELIAACRRAGIPLIGVHLDRWSGLERESQVGADPYFRGVDIFFSADGDADELWEREGVNHRWLLPAISERWLGLGEVRPEYDCDVVFVGGWHDYGHRKWRHRAELIEHLTSWYGDRFLALPRRGKPRIVGRDLNDVYASARVVVGDSCLVPHPDGRPKARYCSDRIPETLGRGGYLLHPAVDGITGPDGGAFYRSEAPLCDYWEMGDWTELKYRIDFELGDGTLGSPGERQWRINQIAESHTYTQRVHTIVAELNEQGVL